MPKNVIPQLLKGILDMFHHDKFLDMYDLRQQVHKPGFFHIFHHNWGFCQYKLFANFLLGAFYHKNMF